MVVTGVIKEINVSSNQSIYSQNLYKVDIGIFKTTANLNSTNSIVECTASVTGGIYQPYNVGDGVYVDFLNDEENSPIIIGKIYTGLDISANGARSFINARALTITDNATLPANTTIGGLSFSDLSSNYSHQNKAILDTVTSVNQVRNITVSTSDPSGGNDGDIWLKYSD